MILVWFLAWLLEHQPHVQVLPIHAMNTWGFLLILAIILA